MLIINRFVISFLLYNRNFILDVDVQPILTDTQLLQQQIIMLIEIVLPKLIAMEWTKNMHLRYVQYYFACFSSF